MLHWRTGRCDSVTIREPWFTNHHFFRYAKWLTQQPQNGVVNRGARCTTNLSRNLGESWGKCHSCWNILGHALNITELERESNGGPILLLTVYNQYPGARSCSSHSRCPRAQPFVKVGACAPVPYGVVPVSTHMQLRTIYMFIISRRFLFNVRFL